MSDRPDSLVEGDGSSDEDGRIPLELLVAFAIGTFVGVGLAATWVPERSRRALPPLARGYRRARDAGAKVLAEARRRGSDMAVEFREELAANLEAAREEIGDMTREQLAKAHEILQREYGKHRHR